MDALSPRAGQKCGRQRYRRRAAAALPVDRLAGLLAASRPPVGLERDGICPRAAVLHHGLLARWSVQMPPNGRWSHAMRSTGRFCGSANRELAPASVGPQTRPGPDHAPAGGRGRYGLRHARLLCPVWPSTAHRPDTADLCGHGGHGGDSGRRGTLVALVDPEGDVIGRLPRIPWKRFGARRRIGTGMKNHAGSSPQMPSAARYGGPRRRSWPPARSPRPASEFASTTGTSWSA